MSMPQKMLMIQPTMTMAVRIWMRAAAMFSQKTQHTCLSGRSVRAPHSTAKAETNVPVNRGGSVSGAGDAGMLLAAQACLPPGAWGEAACVQPLPAHTGCSSPWRRPSTGLPRALGTQGAVGAGAVACGGSDTPGAGI